MDTATAITPYQQALNRLWAQVVLNIDDTAALLGVDRKSLVKAMDSGQIPTVQIGVQRKVPSAKLRVMLGLVDAPAREEQVAA